VRPYPSELEKEIEDYIASADRDPKAAHLLVRLDSEWLKNYSVNAFSSSEERSKEIEEVQSHTHRILKRIMVSFTLLTVIVAITTGILGYWLRGMVINEQCSEGVAFDAGGTRFLCLNPNNPQITFSKIERLGK
jgi:hypothetical protein